MKKFQKLAILICIFLTAYATIVSQITDYDYWFHYATGEWIVQNHEIPNTAIWSWYGLENNLKWISHEWLFGLFIYGWTNIFGQTSLVILCPALIALAITLAFAFTYEKWKGHWILMCFIVIFVSLGGSAVNAPRPQLFMYLMFVVLCKLLFDEYDKPSKQICFLPLLTIFWVNLHGGSYAIIFFLFALLIICQSFSFKLGRLEFVRIDKNITRKRLLVFLISLLCVVINGHGLDMYLYPITNMTDTVMLNNISEWSSINFHSITYYEFIALALLAFYVGISLFTKGKIDPYKLLFLGVWVYLFFKSVRFFFLLDLTLIFLIAKQVYLFKEKSVEDLIIIIASTFIVMLGVCIYRTADVIDDPFNTSEFPSEKIIEALQELPEDTHLFNDYNVGGYLVYRHVEVFIDGRADIYSKYNMSDYANVKSLNIDPSEFIEKYNLEYLLITNDSQLDWWCQKQQDYKLSIEVIDEDFTLYKILNKI